MQALFSYLHCAAVQCTHKCVCVYVHIHTDVPCTVGLVLPISFTEVQVTNEDLVRNFGSVVPGLEEMDTVQVGDIHSPVHASRTNKCRVYIRKSYTSIINALEGSYIYMWWYKKAHLVLGA